LRFSIGLRVIRDQHADAPHPLGLLRARRNRPGRRTTDKRDEEHPSASANPRKSRHAPAPVVDGRLGNAALLVKPGGAP
jgi:hypothetical protein